MDLWSVHVKNTTNILQLKNFSILDKPISSWNIVKSISPSGSSSLKRSRSFVITAKGKKNYSDNGDISVPEGEGPREKNLKPLDWREFRALLYINEQAKKAHDQENTSRVSKSLPIKWAHPISSLENGCLLVSSEKLDGVRNFERTVILLLSSGTRQPQKGPFGIVINHPIPKKVKHMKPNNLHLATTFTDCSLHFGGPLEASLFLLGGTENSYSDLSAFEEVIPGVFYGSRNNLDEAGRLIENGILKPHDFRFFFGYAGWKLDQLKEEIELGFWHLSACSSNLVFATSQYSSSSQGLWEEILQLMGGQYSELSRKPKQDL